MKKIVLMGIMLFSFCCTSSAVFAKAEPVPPTLKLPAKYTPEYIQNIYDEYKDNSKYELIHIAIDMLKGTEGEFSRKALLGYNLSGKPVKIEFKDLSTIHKDYSSFDAIGWKRKNKLFIYINPKHKDAPPAALAALLAHEALHQDDYNSLSEETYAWTMEAAVWCELLQTYPECDVKDNPLVKRENTLKQLFERGGYSNKYIKKAVYANKGYQALPLTSPGFQDL